MTSEEADKLRNGIYVLVWMEGDASVASVGRDSAGRVWFAPSNWLTVPWFDWEMVKEAVWIDKVQVARNLIHPEKLGTT